MKLYDLVNEEELAQCIADRYIRVQSHPTLPLDILNYTNDATFDRHWSDAVRKCRGLIINRNTLEIVARPMEKFFDLGVERAFQPVDGNLVEVPLVDPIQKITMQELYDSAMTTGIPLELTRKMDGWFGIHWEFEGQYGVASRGSFTSPGAIFATEKFQRFVKYTSVEFIPKGYSLIFEIIARPLRIVIPYDWEGLCLLTAINIETGEELTYSRLAEVHKAINQYAKDRPWCRLVEHFEDMMIQDALADDSLTEEGYIVTAHRPGQTSLKAKIKLAEYRRVSRILTRSSPQSVWEKHAYPLADFDYEHLPKDFKKWLDGFTDDLYRKFHEKLVKAVTMELGIRGVLGPRPTKDRSAEQREFDIKMQDVLLRTMRPGDLEDAVTCLVKGNALGAYQSIWKKVRPYGKEASMVFYEEGRGE